MQKNKILSSDLDIEFKVFFDRISNLEQTLAPDILLKLYAFNKQAESGDTSFSDSNSDGLINGFKFNAWQQLRGMSQEKAKKGYIKLAKSILKKYK